MVQMCSGGVALAAAFSLSELSLEQVWMSYLLLGGDATRGELEAYLRGESEWWPYHHDLLAQALNDHFVEVGLDHLAPYSSQV